MIAHGVIRNLGLKDTHRVIGTSFIHNLQIMLWGNRSTPGAEIYVMDCDLAGNGIEAGKLNVYSTINKSIIEMSVGRMGTEKEPILWAEISNKLAL